MKPKYRSRRYCAFTHCPNDSISNPDKYFFTFPLDRDRCKQWVLNSGRTDFADKHPAQLCKSFFICSDHFKESNVLSCATGPRLRLGTVPIKFDSGLSKLSANGVKRKATAPPGKTKQRKGIGSSSGVPTDAKDLDLGHYICAENICKVEINEEEAGNTTATNCHLSAAERRDKQEKWTGKSEPKGSWVKQIETLNQEILRLQTVVQNYKKLKSEETAQNLNLNETLAKVKGKLQYEAQVRQKWKTSLEQLGLSTDCLDDREIFFERILLNPDLVQALMQRVVETSLNDNSEKSSNGELKACLKMLQTQVSTLESERTVLRVACAQLSAEKDEAVKGLEYFKENYDRLLRDQINLEKSQEQLVTKNEELLERGRVTQRSFNNLQLETRSLREEILSLKEQINSQQASKVEEKS